ncbi:MAG: methyltransferase domain-containing protein [Myxococcales bacterium]|nr:methyltransferase domain-containing protein [Myxococcales bacterium]
MPISDSFHYDGADLEALQDLVHYPSWIMDYLSPVARGDILEVGPGLGAVSKRLRIISDSLDLLEPSARHASLLADFFRADEKVRVLPFTVEAFAAHAPRGVYDTVVAINILEHLEDDLTALETFFRVLRPGGFLFLFVPALRFLYSEFDRRIGHFRRYHLGELKRLVEGARFVVETIRYFDMSGVVPWWVTNTVVGSTQINPRFAQWYDRLVVPVSRRLERRFTPPLGKNLVVVARHR